MTADPNAGRTGRFSRNLIRHRGGAMTAPLARQGFGGLGHQLTRVVNKLPPVMVLLLALVAAGCIGGVGGGGSPHNLMFTVANEWGNAATISEVMPGLLGTPVFPSTATYTIEGCNQYLTAFGAGHNEVKVTAGQRQLQLVFDLTSQDQLSRFVVIDPNGAISEVDESAMPTTGC